MPVVTTGDATWRQLTYPLWNVDGFGVDTATVRWNGLAGLKEAFENGLVKWGGLPAYNVPGVAVIPAYPSMSLESWSDAEGTPNIYTLDLHFKGFRSGTIPTPKSVDSTSAQSAQGQGTYADYTDPSGDVVSVQVGGTVYYYASRTTWTWFETSQPAISPRYNTVNQQVNPFNTIYRYSLTTQSPNASDDGQPVNSINSAALATVLQSLAPSAVVTDYTRELIIPGKLWFCSSIIDWKLIGGGS